MKWFMSYAYDVLPTAKVCLASKVYRGDKHPIAVIEELNEQEDGEYVLLSFQQLPDEPLSKIPEHHRGITANYL